MAAHLWCNFSKRHLPGKQELGSGHEARLVAETLAVGVEVAGAQAHQGPGGELRSAPVRVSGGRSTSQG